MTKKYCVHVYPRMYDYENVEAATPERAEEIIVNAEFAGDYDDIDHVEVMIECGECGTDNETDAKTCNECGEDL